MAAEGQSRSPDAGEESFSNRQKNPEDWKTGDERMTGAQASYLETLSQEAGEEFDPHLTKAEASKRIDELRHKTGRGLEEGEPEAG
ncbi:MAG TPA: DUF3072 domain-containing protein [Thermoanaerobaculia bacterium]|nr:DUF3072 domain-containing protein [Thermoanaerobaculia bacterium]